jgi:hypothetical protein
MKVVLQVDFQRIYLPISTLQQWQSERCILMITNHFPPNLSTALPFLVAKNNGTFG